MSPIDLIYICSRILTSTLPFSLSISWDSGMDLSWFTGCNFDELQTFDNVLIVTYLSGRLENDFIFPVNDVDINIQHLNMNHWAELLTLHLDDFGYLNLSQRWNVTTGDRRYTQSSCLGPDFQWVQILSGSVGQVVYLGSQKPISSMAFFPVNTGNSKAHWFYVSLSAQCSWTVTFTARIRPAWYKNTEGKEHDHRDNRKWKIQRE